jgi:hypothetical protein
VDHRRRKLRRRREALDAWRALARTRDPRDHMQHEIRDLRAALDAWQDVAMAHIRRETRALRAEIAALTRGHSHEVVDRGSVSGHPGRLRVRRPELPSELAIVDPAGRTAKDDAR